MIYLLAILFLFIFSVLSYRRPIGGAAIIIALLPTYQWRWSLLGWPSTFLELLILVLFIIWLSKDKKYKLINFSFSPIENNPLPPVWRRLLAVWLAVGILALYINPTLSALGLWRAYFLEPTMFFLLLIYELKKENDFKLIIAALAVLLTWLFALTIFQYYRIWPLPAAYDWPQIRRMTGIFSYPNALSLLTAPLASFFLGWGLVTDKKIKPVYFLLFLLGLVLAYLAKSEGAILGIVVAFIFWLILDKKVRKIARPLLVILFFVFVISAPGKKIGQDLRQQIFMPQLDLGATSLEIRSSQWQEDWRFLQEHFIFGAGLNAYQKAVAPYHHIAWLEIYLYPHNIFLNFWTELGLLGLATFLFIFIKIIFTLRDLYRAQSSWTWPLTLFWMTWFTHGLVDVPYFKNDLSVLFFIFLALTIASRKIGKFTVS